MKKLMTNEEYERTANVLVERIEKLVPGHPEILQMEDPFALFTIAEFDCADLAPSLAQGMEALREVKRRHRGNGSGE